MQINTIPNGYHQGHFELGNSGIKTLEEWKDLFLRTEEIAYNEYEKNKIVCIGDFLVFTEMVNNIIHPNQDNKKELSPELKNIATPFVKHGGGTILEYVLLAKQRGNDTCNIVIHEPRVGLFQYPGEEVLDGVSRGIHAFNNIDLIRKKCDEYEKKFKIKINIGIEREDFEDYKEGKEFRKQNTDTYKKFDFQIHSKHSMNVDGKNIPIDSDSTFFDKIYNEYKGNYKEIILQYIDDLNRITGINGKKGDTLAHPDLIVYAIYQKELEKKKEKNREKNLVIFETKKIIKSLFNDVEIEKKYSRLINILEKKKMGIGINLALGAKLGDYQSFYGETILELLEKSHIPVYIEKDTHSLEEEQSAQEIWNNIKGKLKKLNLKNS